MSYTPPRGRCNFKSSLMSPACPCLRFMLHPVKAATSFECDGCGHHASFHSLENAAEDAVIKKWDADGKKEIERQANGGASAGGARKRKRIAGRPESTREGGTGEAREVVEIEDMDETDPGDDMVLFQSTAQSEDGSKKVGKSKRNTTGRGAGGAPR